MEKKNKKEFCEFNLEIIVDLEIMPEAPADFSRYVFVCACNLQKKAFPYKFFLWRKLRYNKL